MCSKINRRAFAIHTEAHTDQWAFMEFFSQIWLMRVQCGQFIFVYDNRRFWEAQQKP